MERASNDQLQPPHIGFIPQVLPEVEAIHKLVDETKRMCVIRIDSNE